MKAILKFLQKEAKNPELIVPNSRWIKNGNQEILQKAIYEGYVKETTPAHIKTIPPSSTYVESYRLTMKGRLFLHKNERCT